MSRRPQRVRVPSLRDEPSVASAGEMVLGIETPDLRMGAITVLLLTIGVPVGAQPVVEAPLAFVIREGGYDNHFYRDGHVAAHLLLRSGDSPRIVIAFLAGNSGAALWFVAIREPLVIELDGEIAPIEEGAARGIAMTIVARGRAQLEISQPVLGSIRVIRDYMHARTLPDGLVLRRAVTTSRASFSRRSADGDHHYRLDVAPLGVTPLSDDGAVLSSDAGEIRFRLRALTDEPPLTPIPAEALLTADAAADPRARRVLAFLSYEEKLLAGSWRFLTCFGRDTLMSTRLLAPVLTPRTIEAALGSVLERLSPAGEVAHEEEIGEFPALRGERAPVFDYKMVDDDFMLAPVLAHYVFDTPEGATRRRAFLARRISTGDTYAEALQRNLERVLAWARPYAAAPGVTTLIHTKDDLPVGNWRDSEEGLGGGRVPYDVNAILVPAALEAAVRLFRLPDMVDAARADEAAQLLAAWSGAGRHFDVVIESADARERVAQYARALGIPAKPALDAIGEEPVAFPGVALDRNGRPLPVMHSDDGFAVLFARPAPAELRRMATRVERPFPAGLATPIGLVVANPAFAADPHLCAMFSREHYHGVVVWSWQQALMASGLARQLDRRDLDGGTRAALTRAQRVLWQAIAATYALRTSELWSWDHDARSGWQLVPFGQRSGHQTESNAAQLWSAVYLAIEPPRQDP